MNRLCIMNKLSTTYVPRECGDELLVFHDDHFSSENLFDAERG